MEIQNKKPKLNKKRLFLIIFVLFVSIFLSVSTFNFIKYKTSIGEKVKLSNFIPSMKSDTISNKNNDLKGLSNPRMKIRNSSGTEVIGLDHTGDITFNGNLTGTTPPNGYGFFRYLGDSATKITTGWFTNLFAENINSTAINSSTIKISGINVVAGPHTIDTTIGNCSGDQSCNSILYNTDLPLENQTKSYCGNITGSTSDLCTLTDTDTQKTTNAQPLYNDSTSIYFNNTFNNDTIDNRISLNPQGFITTVSDDSVIIKYQNISNLPTCSGTDKLTFDGTTLTCATDNGGSGGDGTGGWTNNSIETNTSLNVNINNGHNITSNWFFGFINWSWIQNIPSYVKDWSFKLNETDQRYNETNLINSVNTTNNIVSLINDTYVNEKGDSMTGNLSFSDGNGLIFSEGQQISRNSFNDINYDSNAEHQFLINGFLRFAIASTEVRLLSSTNTPTLHFDASTNDGYITWIDSAKTFNIDNNLNITSNTTINDRVCFNADCSSSMYNNGSGIIIQ